MDRRWSFSHISHRSAWAINWGQQDCLHELQAPFLSGVIAIAHIHYHITFDGVQTLCPRLSQSPKASKNLTRDCLKAKPLSWQIFFWDKSRDFKKFNFPIKLENTRLNHASKINLISNQSLHQYVTPHITTKEPCIFYLPNNGNMCPCKLHISGEIKRFSNLSLQSLSNIHQHVGFMLATTHARNRQTGTCTGQTVQQRSDWVTHCVAGVKASCTIDIMLSPCYNTLSLKDSIKLTDIKLMEKGQESFPQAFQYTSLT